MVPVFKNAGERASAKSYHPVSLLSVLSNVFEKLVNNRIVVHLQIFSQLYLIELLRLLTSLAGLLELWHLIYPKLLTGFGMLVFFPNLSLMDFQVRYLALFLLFLVIDGFEWVWVESLYKNIQLMLVFLNAPFLVLHFFCNILITWQEVAC